MDGLLGTISSYAQGFQAKAWGILDSIFPPEKRAEVLSRLQTFAITNPKLSAFLLTNIALTGPPLALFILFTVTVFIFSLIAALLLALLVALLFTAFAVGAALLIVLPTVFLTTGAASFLFLWGLGGYYLIRWFNKGETPTAPGAAIGDKLNSLTGGRMGFLMDGARAQEAAGREKKDGSAPEKAQNGGVQEAAKNVDVAGVQEKATGATKTAAGSAEGVKSKGGTAVGGVKGAVGGTTGLA